MRTIYLDNNASTAVAPEVLEAMLPYFTEHYANPAGLHRMGIEAERAIKNGQRTLAGIFGLSEDEIIFTSGGTESINTALRGAAHAGKRKGKTIITSPVEHKAVLETLRELIEEGFSVVYAEVDRFGQVRPEAVQDAITGDTILVSIMHANNELGTINDVAAIARAVKAKDSGITFFSDGVQAFGKLPLDLADIDMYAASGHKFHAPKGVGVLAIKRSLRIKPLITGGGQQRGMRSGTENVSGVAGIAKAAEIAYRDLHETHERIAGLRGQFVSGLRAMDNVHINSPDDAIASTVHASFPGIPAEVLLHALEDRGVYVSSGAICTDKKQNGSHVLRACGLAENIIGSGLRFCFSRYTTEDEIAEALHALRDSLAVLRK